MICATCKKMGARACSRCQDCPALKYDDPIVHYCCDKCEEADRLRHFVRCHRLQDRRKLYRVSAVAQKLFYVYRELTCGQVKVKEVEKIGDTLVLRGNLSEYAQWPVDYRAFPSELFTSANYREAALSYLGCIDAMEWMNEFIEGMLEDIVLTTDQVCFKTKNDKLRTRCYPLHTSKADIEADFRGVEHHILKVILQSGETFAVDIAGAQYGYYEPVTAWSEYYHQRVLFEYSRPSVPLKSPQRVLHPHNCGLEDVIASKKLAMANDDQEGRGCNVEFLEKFNAHMVEWQYRKALAIEELLGFPMEQYQNLIDELVDFVEWKYHAEGRRNNYRWETANGKRLMVEYGEKWFPAKWVKEKS